MSPLPLLSLVALLLLVPWILRPRRYPLPEIRGSVRLLWWLNVFYCTAWHRLRCKALAPLPEHGSAILIANHTCMIDHMILQASCDRILGFIIAQEFYDLWYCRPFCRIMGCIPVRRDGRDLSGTRAAIRALADGRVVPIFPEGKITPSSGEEFGEPKTGVAFLALHSRAPIYPAYIRGTPPYNTIGKSLATPSDTRITYGPRIDLSAYEGIDRPSKETLAEVTELLMASIRNLRAQSLAEDDS